MHVLPHCLHCTAGYNFTRSDTQTVLLADESITLFALKTPYNSESVTLTTKSHPAAACMERVINPSFRATGGNFMSRFVD
jgi:hypothetical protein